MNKKIDLSQRLQLVCNLCETGEKIADIGCDHGFTSISLIKNGQYKRALAMDVRKGPLDRAMTHVREYGVSNVIETRLGSGFDMMQAGECDAAVITGMGGSLICSILSKEPLKTKSVDKLILGPQSENYLLRRLLRELNFSITKEAMLNEDGKYYQIIVAKRCEGTKVTEEINEAYDYFGEYLLLEKNEILHEYLLKELQLNNNIYEGLLKKASEVKVTDSINSRIKEVSGYIGIINTALSFYN